MLDKFILMTFYRLCSFVLLFFSGFVLNGQCLSVSSYIEQNTCPSICDGEIDLTVSGGSGNYYYFWSTGDSGDNMNQLDGLCSGEYSVVVVDLGQIEETRRILDPDGVLNLSLEYILRIISQTQYDCIINEFNFTITPESLDCGTAAPSACPILPNGGCDCPLIVTVETVSASCPASKDGQIILKLGGGSGYYNVVWSNQSRSTYQQVYGGAVYTATITDTDGRLMVVDVPVGIISNDCTEGVGISFGSRTVLLLLTDLTRDNALLTDLIEELYIEIERILGPFDISIYRNFDLIGCDLHLSLSLESPTYVPGVMSIPVPMGEGGACSIRMYNGRDDTFYNITLDGEFKGTSADDNTMRYGYHSVVAENDACSIVYGFTFSPTCLEEGNVCNIEFTVSELERPGCTGAVSPSCNGKVALEIEEQDPSDTYIVTKTDDNGVSEELGPFEDPYIIIGNICLNVTYTFEVTNGSCTGVNGILLNKEVAEEICCPIKKVSIDENALYCSGERLYVYASGGDEDDDYLWSGTGIRSSKSKSFVEITVQDVNTDYMVVVGNKTCKDVTQREIEIPFTIRVHDVPNIDIIPSGKTYCFLNNDELPLESRYINKPSYMQYNTSWVYPTLLNTGFVEYISPTPANMSTLYFDRIDPNNDIDRSLIVFPVVNYANCEGQNVANCELVCKLVLPKQRYVLLKDSPDIEIPDVIDVCAFSVTSVIDLNSYIGGRENIDEICWRTSQTPPRTCLTDLEIANYSVNGNHTISLSVVTTNGCEVTKDIAVNFIELDAIEYDVLGSNCKDGYVQVVLPFENNYQWTPSDGLSCNDCHLNRIYLDQAVDNYSVDVSSKNIKCKGSITVDITSFRETLNKSLDNLDFVSEKIGASDCGYSFTSTITDADRYIWNFGDGTIIETTNPTITHSFFNPGVYKVELLCQKDCAENEVNKTIDVEISNCTCN